MSDEAYKRAIDSIRDSFGNVKYADGPPQPYYCPTCGYEDGTYQPHAEDCPCFMCGIERRAAAKAERLRCANGTTIQFRRLESL